MWRGTQTAGTFLLTPGLLSPILVLVLAATVDKEPLHQFSPVVISVLAKHAEDVEVAEAGCAVLWLLSLLGEQPEVLVTGRVTLDT